MQEALIDTDILSYYFKGQKNVQNSFIRYLRSFDRFNLSIITYYKVVSGLKAKNANRQLKVFDEFCEINNILPITEASINISDDIYAKLKKIGEIIDDIDLLIAGVALENKLILVINNTKHFDRIPNLKVDNWYL